MSVATTCVHEVLRFLQLHLAKAIKGCPINGAFACNTLGFAGLREKREFDCESYDFGQAGDGPLRSPFPDAQLRRYVRPGGALCPHLTRQSQSLRVPSGFLSHAWPLIVSPGEVRTGKMLQNKESRPNFRRLQVVCFREARQEKVTE